MSNKVEPEQEDVGYALARNVANVRYEDIPDSAVDTTKKSILDTLGTIIAGSGGGAGIKQFVDLVKEGGGKEESSIIGYGIRVPAWMAAFANGAMAHSLDYDNIHEAGGGHHTATTLPSALALAERVGGVSGKEFIAAITLGDDLHCRMGFSLFRAGPPNVTWLTPVVFGVFSAAAASGRVLKLREDQILDAFGIACNQAGGTFELVFGVGSVLRGMYASFPAITGVLSALMAQRGITGVKTCLEGKTGVYSVYFGNKYDRASLTTDLGKVFECADTSFKPWPSCRYGHTYIDATLQIVAEQDIHPDEVEKVTVFVGDLAKTLCEPLEVRRGPATAMEAKFSLPFVLAATIARRTVVIRDFTPEGLKDEATLQLAQRVVPEYDPGLKGPFKTPPAKVEIRTKNGKVYSRRVEAALGHPRNPIAWDSLVAKFRDCTAYSARPIPQANIDRVIGMVRHLEEVPDVSEIAGLVAGQ